MNSSKCCVPNCNRTRADNTVLHLFPNPKKNSTRFTTWINAIGGGVTDMAPESVFLKCRICHLHFETRYNTWSNRLSYNAISTLNIPGHGKKSAFGANITNSGVTSDSRVTAASGVITNNRNVTDGANIEDSTVSDNIQEGVITDSEDQQNEAYNVLFNDLPRGETEDQIFSWQRDSEINCDDFEMNLDTMELAPEQNSAVIETEVTFDNSLEEASPESNNEPVNLYKEEDLHEGYKCDMCKGVIYRFRYSCVECANYDLCAACEARAVHPEHYMLRVPRPRPHGEIQLIMDTIRRFLTADPKSLRAEANFVNTLMDEMKSEVLSEADSDPVPVEPDYPIHSEDSSEEHDDCEMEESHATRTAATEHVDQDVIFLDENISEEYEISQEICKTVDTTNILTASDKERDKHARSHVQIVNTPNKPERIILNKIDSPSPTNTIGKVSKRIFVTCTKTGSISNDVHKHKSERKIVKIDSLSPSNVLGKAGKRIVLLPLPKRPSVLNEALQLRIVNSDDKKKQETLKVLKQTLQSEVSIKMQRLSKQELNSAANT